MAGRVRQMAALKGDDAEYPVNSSQVRNAEARKALDTSEQIVNIAQIRELPASFNRISTDSAPTCQQPGKFSKGTLAMITMLLATFFAASAVIASLVIVVSWHNHGAKFMAFRRQLDDLSRPQFVHTRMLPPLTGGYRSRVSAGSLVRSPTLPLAAAA